jgi:nucleotide-binding universal stress UspA family protein
VGLIIISYDGTPNDDDALALGRMLARTGASLALAYVRHSREYDPQREELAAHDASRRLAQGATSLGDPGIAQHVVVSASTGEGLARLAAEQDAVAVVFGSDYRTPPGSVEPGTTAQHMLERGTVAVAVAPAGLRSHPDASIGTVAVFADGDDPAGRQTADALIEKLGANEAEPTPDADLIVVGSQGTAPEGRIGLGGPARAFLNSARSAVLVVPRGRSVAF